MSTHKPNETSPPCPQGTALPDYWQKGFSDYDWLEIPVYILNNALRCIYANHAACDLFGTNVNELAWHPITTLFPRHEAAVLSEADALALRSEKAHYTEASITCHGKKGHFVFYRRCRPLPESKDSALCLLVMLLDISSLVGERERAYCLEQVISLISDRIFIVDEKYRFVLVNEAVCLDHGLSQRKITGRTLSEVFGHDIFESVFKPQLDRCLGGESTSFQGSIPFAPQRNKTLDYTCTPWIGATSGQRLAIVSWQVAYEPLPPAASTPWGESLFFPAPAQREACCILDNTGRLLSFNQATAMLTGYGEDDLLLLRFDKDLCCNAEDFWNMVGQLDTSKAVHNAPLDLLHQDGQLLQCRCDLHSKHDKHGMLVGMECVLRSATQTDSPQEQQKRYRLSLERRVLERTSELTKTNKLLLDKILELENTKRELSEYRNRLRELAYEISLVEQRERRRLALELHDGIGQDLAMARIKLSALKEDVSSQKISHDCHELLNLTKKMIAQSRCLIWEMGSPELYELGFAAAIEELAEEFEERHNIKVICSNHRQNEIVLEEDQQIMLFQMVRELMTNVLKHAQASTVTIDLQSNALGVTCSVTDDGKGFQDIQQNTAKHKRDSGFGLFSIRERLDIIGGALNIQSTSLGTRCTLFMPRQNTPSRSKEKSLKNY